MITLRILGSGLIVAAMAAVAIYATGLGDVWGFTAKSLGELGHQLDAGSLEVTKNMEQTYAPKVWDLLLLTLLGLAALLLVGFIGLALYRVGARRRTASVTSARTDASKSEAATVSSGRPASPRSELTNALSSCKSAFLSIGLFSGMINVLMLTGAFFMLQIYDRVLPSGSLPTLVALAILVAGLFTVLAILDMIRGRILVRIGSSLDEALSSRVYDAVVRLPLKRGNRGDGVQPLRDLDSVRTFLSGTGPTALFDLPWMPLYLAIIFAFHIFLGITAVVGAIVLVGLTLMTEALSRKPMQASSAFALTRYGLAEASRRNAEVLVVMGMAGRMTARWSEANQGYKSRHQKASDVTGGFGSASKSLRMLLQSAVLGVGAYLVIHQEATAGVMIAAAILVARALAPVDLAIANWKGFLGARQSWKRLTQLLELLPAQATPMALPAPSTSVAVEHASAAPPGGHKVVVHDVSLTLKSGQGLGIIGPSASGKSSLVRMIVGAWEPARGRIRLDGAALDQWSPEALGAHIGYLPQDVELFSATVAQNIARFEADAAPEAIIAAAQAAGVHDLIVGLPQGYETEIGEQGQVLSAGQRQRIALARALYGEPFLVVLDEPNSNLDSEGEAALTQAIASVRKRGGIVIVVAHRPSALAAVDLVLVMANGGAVTFGPKEEVLSKGVAPSAVARGPLSLVPGGGNKTS
jgi:ATP-binding cassette subfamily C protein PrsD